MVDSRLGALPVEVPPVFLLTSSVTGEPPAGLFRT